jgi:hypothetical protein
MEDEHATLDCDGVVCAGRAPDRAGRQGVLLQHRCFFTERARGIPRARDDHAFVRAGNRELKNGYAFRLPAEELVATSQWISYERHCCPFFTFELEIPKDSGPVWLRITGESGIKEFIKTEFEL